MEPELQLWRAPADDWNLSDQDNFESVVAAGPPDDDEAVPMLPIDIEQLRPPLKAWIPIAIRDQVLRRDGWVCWLCGDAIPRDLRHPHPRSSSIDHVQPRADGGGHKPRNLRAAHLGCNVRRGRRAVGIEASA